MELDNEDFILENATLEGALNDTEVHHFPKEMLGFTAACAFIIAIFGTLGNLLTIFALPMCKKLRTTATAYVINLAVVELMFCMFILPMSGAQYAYLQHYTESLLSNRDCIFFAVTRYTLTQVELQTIVAIALTRAVAVGFPRLYTKIDSKEFTGVYISLIWLYSFLLKLPTGLGYFGSYVFNPKTMECDMAMDISSAKARLIMILVEIIIPVLVILILYVFIFVTVMRRSCQRNKKFRKPSTVSNASASSYVKMSSLRVSKSHGKSPKPSSVSGPPSSVSEEPSGDANSRKGSIASYKSLKRMMSDTNLKSRFTNKRRSSNTSCIGTSRRDMRVARTIFIIFMMVMICSIPVGVIHSIDSESKQPRRFLAVHILYWLQYCLNVFVYVLMNRQYRGAYIEFIHFLLPSCFERSNFAFPWENPSVSSKPNPALTSSFKGRKDSCNQDPSAAPQEYKPVEPVAYPKQGRLSAIMEVNSSSFVSSSNDDVFVPNAKTLNGAEKNDSKENSDDEPYAPSVKMHEEKGSLEEKEHWIGQNGQTVRTPQEEDTL